tara:strand:- start:485 stop:604 length:120 start_codon:yes stop_codon:yes gene_type:complete
MALNLFSGIIAVLDYFPEHTFWVFEKIFFFDVIEWVWIF